MNHTGAEQLDAAFYCFGEYDIFRNLGAGVMDNAPSNDVSLRLLHAHLKDRYTIDWDDSQRIRCILHVLNLIACGLIFGKALTRDELADWANEEALEQEAVESVDEEQNDLPSASSPPRDVTRGKGKARVQRITPEKASQESDHTRKKRQRAERCRRIGAIGRLRNIIAHIRGSTARRKFFLVRSKRL